MATTIAYNHKGGYWKTKYTFFASFMQSVGRKFFSSPSAGATVSGGRAQDLLWKHNSDDDSKRANFYGVPSGSGMSVAFNDKVSSNKIYKSFSIEGTNNISGSAINTFVVNSDNNPNKQFSIGPVKDKGGILYGHIGLSNTLLDGSNITPLGQIGVKSVDGLDSGVEIMEIVGGFLRANFVTNVSQDRSTIGSFEKPNSKYILLSQSTLSTGYIPRFFSLYGQEITGIESGISYGSSILGPKTFFSKQVDTMTGETFISFILYDDDGAPIILDDTHVQGDLTGLFTLLEITPQNINGAPPRGQYAQAELFFGSQPYEIFSLNVNYEPTDLDHSK